MLLRPIMSIREYTLEDYDQVISLWLNCGLITSAEKASSEQLSTVSLRNRGLFLVCEDVEKRVIGSVFGAWDGWRGWIYKLAVAPESRRRGLGTRLVEELARRLRDAGASIVRAYIEEGNEASLALFTKCGFESMVGFVIVTQGRQ